MQDQAKIRKPAVAGSFYPERAGQIRIEVMRLFSQIKIKKKQVSPKAIIAPHAGYIYSGPVAASIYARLQNAKDKIKRVVLLGPSHRVGFYGIATSSVDFYETPLGLVKIDKKSITNLIRMPQVQISDEAHEKEHSLEVHLPFLQVALNEFELIPLLVGEAKPIDVSDVLEEIWGGDETLIIISSDLSHYNDYETAKKKDAKTCKAIEAMKPQDIKNDDACGRYPLSGFLHLARQKGLNVETVDLRNSGDTAGSKNSVVGYGAWAFG